MVEADPTSGRVTTGVGSVSGRAETTRLAGQFTATYVTVRLIGLVFHGNYLQFHQPSI